MTAAFELEERISSFAFALTGSDDGEDDDGFHPAAEAAFHQLLLQYDLPIELQVGDARRPLHQALADSYDVRTPDAVARLLRLIDLSRDWKSALVGRRRTLEEFFTRSRSVVAGTCVGVRRRSLGIDRIPFDLVIIDEAAKCTPGELAVAMQSGDVWS